MDIQIITIRAEGLSMDERQLLCDECAAVCSRIAGVQATEWSINPATETVCGLMRWSEYEAITQGTEALCREVAYLRAPGSVLRCREIPCPHRRTSPGARRAQPNTGFVQYPPDYDPRG